MKSPAGRTPQKAYKHVKFMPLSHVRRVVDIRDNDGKCAMNLRSLSLAARKSSNIIVQQLLHNNVDRAPQ